MTKTLATIILILLLSIPASGEEFKSILAKAEQNYANAQYVLGKMYYNGKGVSEDLKKARYWFERSGHLGNSSAQAAVGFSYLVEPPVNFEKAEFWLQKAAYQNDAYSQFNLWRLDFTRNDKPRQRSFAYAWLSIAVEHIDEINDEMYRKQILKIYKMNNKDLSESEKAEAAKIIIQLKKDIINPS